MTGAIARTWGKSRARMAALTLLALGATSPAAGAETEFLGGGFLVVRNDSCAEYGWTGTHQVLARLAPQGAPGNPDDQTQVALLLSTGTIAFRFNSVRNYRYTQVIDQATYVWNGPWSPEEPTMNFYYHYVGNIPSPTDTALDNLVLVFNNFNEHPGCRVDAYLALRRN
ncbi:hypothetical protein C8N33_10952 [Pararhodobacter aggregans]|nr:hypothetical protein C8N33_10952 [Pararhodobacter aggregans]